MREGGASFRFALRQAKADRNGVVDLIHHGRIEPAHVLAQAALVNGAELLEQHDRVLVRPTFRPVSSMCVGSFALFIWLVIAAAITVGECRFPMSFCTMSTGRVPPCSLPTTGLRSA